MSIMHTPITPEEQTAGMARMIAGLSSHAERRERIGNIRRRHGDERAEAVRRQAWALIQSGYRPMRVETPAARASDAPSSHAAADEADQSGRRHRHQRIVAAVVATHPGCTSRELAGHCDLERHEIARRLPELVTAGDVVKGEARTCSIGQRLATTWWPAVAGCQSHNDQRRRHYRG